MIRPCRVLSLALFCTSLVSGQFESRGTLMGRVIDASGAVITGAEVRATNSATGVAASTKSNLSGNYFVPYLVPGFYKVQAEVPGFRRFLRENVQVRVNETVELEIPMAVGDVAETIEVTAETPLLSTAEASLGQVVDERRISELPLFAGNAMDLVHLAPGTVNGTDMRLRKAPFNNAPSQFSTDGSGNYGNTFTIDGIVNMYSDGTSPRVAFSPPAASIAEFKMQTAAFDAQIGGTMGAWVNVSTKGGTNALKGEAWWWLRHSAFDTKTIYQNRSGQSLPKYRDNRYGISGGGPVLIPRVYDGKNRTFWFFTWEANKFGDPNVGGSMTSTVPREAWRNGDLSDLLKIGGNYQVYDPGTIAVAPGGRYSRQPFVGNIIPAGRIHTAAKKLLALWPLPNQPGRNDGVNNFFMSRPAQEDYWTTIGRADHAFSDQHRMFVRVHRDFWEEDKNHTFGDDVTGIVLNRINRGVAIDDVFVFTPAFLMNLRYGITQQEFPQRRVSRGFDLASLGFSPGLTGLVSKELATVPRTSVGSLTRLSEWEGVGDGVTSSLLHSAVANFSWLRGNHSIRFGAAFGVNREFYNRFPADIAPDLSFNSLWGRGPLDNSPAPPVGGELVALLLGLPGGTMTRSGSYAEQDKTMGMYLQDDLIVTRKLTLNLGLRVERTWPMTERFDRSVTQFPGEESNPIEARAIVNYAKSPINELPVSAFRVRGGTTFAGVGGNPRQFWSHEAARLMPRFGIAYKFGPSTVFRAGYGIFHGGLGIFGNSSILAGFTRTTPITASTDNGLTFIAKLDNPLPGGLLEPLGAKAGLENTLGQNTTSFAKDRKSPYAQRWSIGLQHELPGSFVAEASYVGNRSTRVPVTRDASYTPKQYYSTQPFRDTTTINFLTYQSPSPFFGLNPQFTSSTISREALLRQYPHFSNVQYAASVGYSWYHALQMRAEKRFSKGYTLQASYTWSRAMEAASFLNAFDAMPYEGLAAIDRAHRLTGSGIWELPFGRKRRWGADWHPVANFIAGGWQLNGVYQRQSGEPLDFGTQLMFIGDPSTFRLPKSERSTDRWLNTAIVNRNSAQQLDRNVRTIARRWSNVRADSQRRWDFSLIKDFPISERYVMKFRAETFNAMNEVVLRAPERNPTNSAFGTITAQEPPRSWQFALRLVF